MEYASAEAKERALEEDMCKYNLMSYLRGIVKQIKTLPFDKDSISLKIAIDILAYMIFYKRTNISIIVGLLFNRFKDIDLITSVIDDLILDDFLDCDDEDGTLISKKYLTEGEYDYISKLLYPLPMLIRPLELKRNSDTGYVYLPKSCIVLKSHYMGKDVNLDHLNIVNGIPLRINKDVLENCKNKPKKELPTVKAKQNWNKFTRQQREIQEVYGEEDSFYLTHKYDKRGRVYCQGYHISYQGNDYTNACIEFAHGEEID